MTNAIRFKCGSENQLWAFTGHGPIIPEVAFLRPPCPIKKHRCIVNPCFRSWIPCFSESSQPSFCVYTLLRISVGWCKSFSKFEVSPKLFLCAHQLPPSSCISDWNGVNHCVISEILFLTKTSFNSNEAKCDLHHAPDELSFGNP